MPKKASCKSHKKQLIGEIETRITGMQYYEAGVAAGEQVNLERDHHNSHDEHAIRVENGRCEPVGHIPRRLCSWLAPLVDSGKVHVEGYVPRLDKRSTDRDPSTSPLVLSIILPQKGKGLLAKREINTKLDALHDVVRRTYEEVQNYTSADLILELIEGLQPLTQQELLPETRLLLALMPGIAHEVRANNGFGTMAAVQELLSKITIGAPLHHHNLTVFPLSWPQPKKPPYELLGRAIERGRASVEEVSQDGEVPNLAVTNKGRRPILIPEGEILVGAKQNRVVNVTVLVAANSQFTVPVSCVEQGRWRYKSQHFRSEHFAPLSLRSMNNQAVNKNRASHGTAHGDQGQVWNMVAAGLNELKASSPTSSLTDGYKAAEEDLQQYRKEIPLLNGTAGVLVAQGDRIVGMDLFDSPDTLQTLWGRLSDAYFYDALRNRKRRRKTSRKAAHKFLEQVAARVKPRMPALGLGHELEVAGDDVVGNALLYAERICHLAAFSNNNQ